MRSLAAPVGGGTAGASFGSTARAHVALYVPSSVNPLEISSCRPMLVCEEGNEHWKAHGR